MASSATVVGDVVMGESSSVWYGAIVRGEFFPPPPMGAQPSLPALPSATPANAPHTPTHSTLHTLPPTPAGDKAPVRVGRNVSVLDNALVLTTKGGKGGVELGNDVVIAPGAVVRSATIGEGAMIGMGAQVLAGASVGADSFVDAGAVLGAGASIPPGQLWTGVPARFLRNLAPTEMAYLRSTASAYGALGAEHGEEGAKSTARVEEDEELRWAKIEGGYAPNVPVSQVDPDVSRYYALTEKHANPGLFRDEETAVGVEVAAREAAEIAADRAEEAYHNAVARNKRVGEAMGLLVGSNPARPELKVGVLEALGRRDAEGRGMLEALMAKAVEAAAPSAPQGLKEDVLRTIKSLSPPAATPGELAVTLAALAAHGGKQ